MRISRQMQVVIDEYRPYLEPIPSGDSVEDLITSEVIYKSNAVRYIMADQMRAKVDLLVHLDTHGLLVRLPPGTP